MKHDQLTSPGTYRSVPASEAEPDLDLNDIIRTILRRRSLLFKCLLGALLLAAIYLGIAKRRYRAEAQLQLLSQSSTGSVQPTSDSDSNDVLALGVAMETYVGILTSDNLALQVVRELNLEHTPEFAASPSPSGNTASDEQNMPLEQTRFRRERILRQFRKGLTVASVTGSRLINVSYLSTNPELAKKILNQLLTDFIAYNYNVRYNASMDSEGWLAKQLADLKKNVEETQEKAASLQQKTGIYGTDGAHNLILTRLELLDQELTGAEQNRIVKGAILHVIHNGNPEAVSNLLGNGGQASAPEAINALALIQSLRQQETSLSSQLADLSTRYGENYPRVIETTQQLAAVRQDIAKETHRLTERAENDYAAALDQETTLRQQLNAQKQAAEQANDLSVQYLIANREATSSRDLYEHLLEKLKEAGIMAGVHDTNINIVDAAHVGAAPASPNKMTILGGALAGGLLLGLCAIFLSEGLDRSLYDSRAAERITGKPLLGIVPLAKSSGQERLWNAASLWPASLFTEAFRSIRTTTLSTLQNTNAKVLAVTSASRSEGKSTVTFNLAGVLAQQGLRVLVIDADLRDKGLSELLGISSSPGLSDLLSDTRGQLKSGDLIRREGLVDVLPAGSSVGNPSELLVSPRTDALLTELRVSYDYLLADTRALLQVTDSSAFSQKADAVILVCRAAVTSKAAFQRAFNLLSSLHVPVIGTIYNAANLESPEYAYLYGESDAKGKGFLAGMFGLARRTDTLSERKA